MTAQLCPTLWARGCTISTKICPVYAMSLWLKPQGHYIIQSYTNTCTWEMENKFISPWLFCYLIMENWPDFVTIHTLWNTEWQFYIGIGGHMNTGENNPSMWPRSTLWTRDQTRPLVHTPVLFIMLKSGRINSAPHQIQFFNLLLTFLPHFFCWFGIIGPIPEPELKITAGDLLDIIFSYLHNDIWSANIMNS